MEMLWGKFKIRLENVDQTYLELTSCKLVLQKAQKMNIFCPNFSRMCLCRHWCSLELKSFSPDNWEVPFENISDLQWLGSGAQGAVFVGKLDNELVAVKKVKEEKDANIHHLRKLNHPNIIQVIVCFFWAVQWLKHSGRLHAQETKRSWVHVLPAARLLSSY